jgi:beta-phosphoglucomutase-like phosphatase (HAD superfamily)
VPFDAVILDVDGTMVDSNDAHARACVDDDPEDLRVRRASSSLARHV